MIPVTSYSSGRVAVFGLGRSGLSVCRSLLLGDANIICSDDSAEAVLAAERLGYPTSDFRELDWSDISVLVLSPGVPLTHPSPHWVVSLARSHNVEIIGDIELFAREVSDSSTIIAVTGTNGKSTTVALLDHLLRSVDYSVESGGNIGRPVLDLAPPSGSVRHIYVLECSSYQIDLSPSLSPDIGVLLNITPDHLDRHGTIENYVSIKECLVSSSRRSVISVDDDWCREIASGLSGVVSVSCNSDSDIHYSDGFVCEKDAADRIELGLSLRGLHNAQNAACALGVCGLLDISASDLSTSVADFSGLPHRMELVGKVGSVLFVNDSKATNAYASAPALSTYRDIHWIAGGVPKSGGISELSPYFGHLKHVYLIGDSSDLFSSQLGDSVPHTVCGTLTRAVSDAVGRATSGDVVLLSPSASSFDQFENFEARGLAFCDVVSSLEGYEQC